MNSVAQLVVFVPYSSKQKILVLDPRLELSSLSFPFCPLLLLYFFSCHCFASVFLFPFSIHFFLIL
jgi:hypothetical protein